MLEGVEAAGSAAAEFAYDLLYRRGVISGWWIALPVGISIGLAAIISLTSLHAQSSSNLAFMAAFYGCIAFFAHAYSVGWRAGTFLWQYLALLVTVALLAIASWLHLDNTGINTASPHLARAALGEGSHLVIAAGLDGFAAVLLLLHCTVLGFGARDPQPTASYPVVPEQHVLPQAPPPLQQAETGSQAEIGSPESREDTP